MKVTVTMDMLRANGACPEGIDFFLSIKAESIEWTIDQQLWFATTAPSFYGWCVRKGLLPLMSMAGADLKGKSLVGANLAGVDLSGADLTGVDLSGASLHGADLTGAILKSAKLEGVNLQQATLKDAVLDDAKLANVNFDKALADDDPPGWVTDPEDPDGKLMPDPKALPVGDPKVPLK